LAHARLNRTDKPREAEMGKHDGKGGRHKDPGGFLALLLIIAGILLAYLLISGTGSFK
jgi:hypothetical protein